MNKILIIHTGGTISMREDSTTGAVTTSRTHPFVNMTSVMTEIAETHEMVLFNLPSPHITPSHMLHLGEVIKHKLDTEQYDGVVVTHGTDTLEETAYFLDLYLQTEKPVVITGAMRSSNEIGSDGLYNLISSVRVANSTDAQNQGVLVVMNDEIHTAKYVTKTSTSNVATFQSPQFGPVGIITKQAVFFQQKLVTNEHYSIKSLTKKVALIKAFAGMNGEYIEAIHHAGMDGLIIEGFGQGNVPQEAVEAIDQVLSDHIPVVLVSRSYQGIVQPTYSYPGGGKQLKEMGVIFAHGLTGSKARIKLLFALELAFKKDDLVAMFEI
ncbi:asparaginase [Aquibacillus sediminis]|uniref:asparaginase n=1 Tax=Aquibacillus sediminis TaxID=2574734 RepID=UPI001108F0CE|nr:asparaginase [Aquibacillus sediminis]